MILPMAVEIGLDIYSYRKQRTKAYQDLSAWLPLAADEPIKTLGDGSEFKISDYPIGTVFKFSQTLEGSIGGYPSTKVNWGISTQRIYNRKLTDQVFSFAEVDGKLSPSLLHSASLFDATIGEATHMKERFTSYQSLTRIDWVKVWKFGIGVREEEKAKVGLLPRVMRRTKS